MPPTVLKKSVKQADTCDQARRPPSG